MIWNFLSFLQAVAFKLIIYAYRENLESAVQSGVMRFSIWSFKTLYMSLL